MISTLLEGLESSLHYDQPQESRSSCEDEIDREILSGATMRLALPACYLKMLQLNLIGTGLIGIMFAVDFCA